MSSVQELLRACGPAIAAADAPAEVVERAVADGRALWVYIDSCMGTRDIEVSTSPIQGTPAAILLARKVPPELARVGDPHWDYHDDALRGLRIPKPRRGDPLADWKALPVATRESLRREIQAIAERQTAEFTIHRAPAVDVYAYDADRLRFVFDFMIWHAAQSGSDGFDHALYVGEAEVVDGRLLRPSSERRELYALSEHDEPAYDPYIARRHLLDVLRASR